MEQFYEQFMLQQKKANWWDWITSNIIIIKLFYITLIICGSMIAIYIVNRIFNKMINDVLNKDGVDKAYHKTILTMLNKFTNYVITIFAFLFVLQSFGLVDATIIASAAGLIVAALAFGVQDLLKDVISGIFIVLEGHLSIGDEVEIGSYKGKVAEIGIRAVKLIDDNDVEYIMTNQTIKSMTNYSKIKRKRAEEAEKNIEIESKLSQPETPPNEISANNELQASTTVEVKEEE